MRQEQQVPIVLEVGSLSALTTEEAKKISNYIDQGIIFDVQFKDADGEMMSVVGFKPATFSEQGVQTAAAIVTVIKNGSVVKVDAEPIVYDFTSYAADKTTELATGKVEITGVVEEFSGDEYKEVVVIDNTVAEFIGRKYFVIGTATADTTTKYALYNELGDPTGMWVTISPEA